MARVGRRRLFDDTHVLLAIAICVASTIIELVSGNPEVLQVVALGLLYVAFQMGLGAWRTPISRPTPRLLFAVAFVFGLSLTVGEVAARPMTSLYLPIVSVAAAYGRREGLIVSLGAVIAYAAPIFLLDTPVSPLIQRGAAFLVTMVVLAMGTRRTVGALEAAILRARRARTRERRRARQMAGIEAVGHLLARGSSSAALEGLMDLMTGRFGYRYVSIYLLQDDGTVRLGAQRGYETVLETFDGSTGVVGRVMRTRETAFVRDTPRRSRLPRGQPGRPERDLDTAPGSGRVARCAQRRGPPGGRLRRQRPLDPDPHRRACGRSDRPRPGAPGHRPASRALPGPGRVLADRQRVARSSPALRGHRARRSRPRCGAIWSS